MNFNFMTSNPAFNIAETNNKAGTGGNTTLYRTATRHAFDLLEPNGLLLNITLKGIIPDLLEKHFAKKQTHLINFMDNVDVWPYNTCYFIVENGVKTFQTSIQGGLASKIFSPYESDCFPFVYYSGADSGMKGFSPEGANRVIRKLPGKNNDGFLYDNTDIEVDSGWKFAFNVMESKKSYSVTDEPIRGGTICYIPTDTKEQAEKLKLFVENNEMYAKYIKRSKIKYHAFGMRNIKKFDLSQIKTGKEIPVEWNITNADLQDPQTLYNEIIEDRTKVKEQGQVYTPKALVDRALQDLETVRPDAFGNPTYTFCDTMCGNGKFLISILEKKIANGIDKKSALKTIYGVELDPESVEECKDNLLNGDESLRYIVDENIVCHDALTYDYSFNGTNQTKAEQRFESLFSFD